MSYSQQLLGQVPPFIDATVHRDEAVHSGFVPHIRVMKACIQHDDGKRQHVTRVCKKRYADMQKLLSFVLYDLQNLSIIYKSMA